MQGDALKIIRVLITVMIAMFFIEAGVFGYFTKPATLLERLLFVVGGLFLLSSTWTTDLIGLGMVAGALLLHFFVPNLPLVGVRPRDVEKVDLSNVQWGADDNLLNLQAG